MKRSCDTAFAKMAFRGVLNDPSREERVHGFLITREISIDDLDRPARGLINELSDEKFEVFYRELTKSGSINTPSKLISFLIGKYCRSKYTTSRCLNGADQLRSAPDPQPGGGLIAALDSRADTWHSEYRDGTNEVRRVGNANAGGSLAMEGRQVPRQLSREFETGNNSGMTDLAGPFQPSTRQNECPAGASMAQPHWSAPPAMPAGTGYNWGSVSLEEMTGASTSGIGENGSAAGRGAVAYFHWTATGPTLGPGTVGMGGVGQRGTGRNVAVSPWGQSDAGSTGGGTTFAGGHSSSCPAIHLQGGMAEGQRGQVSYPHGQARFEGPPLPPSEDVQPQRPLQESIAGVHTPSFRLCPGEVMPGSPQHQSVPSGSQGRTSSRVSAYQDAQYGQMDLGQDGSACQSMPRGTHSGPVSQVSESADSAPLLSVPSGSRYMQPAHYTVPPRNDGIQTTQNCMPSGTYTQQVAHSSMPPSSHCTEPFHQHLPPGSHAHQPAQNIRPPGSHSKQRAPDSMPPGTHSGIPPRSSAHQWQPSGNMQGTLPTALSLPPHLPSTNGVPLHPPGIPGMDRDGFQGPQPESINPQGSEPRRRPYRLLAEEKTPQKEVRNEGPVAAVKEYPLEESSLLRVKFGSLDFARRFIVNCGFPDWSMVEKGFTPEEMGALQGMPLELVEDRVNQSKRSAKKYGRLSRLKEEGCFLVYEAYVEQTGVIKFKLPRVERESTPLQRAFEDHAVLQVLLEGKDLTYNSKAYYKNFLKEGIYVGLRRFRYFGKKDPKSSKKKGALWSRRDEDKGVKLFFVATESWAAFDLHDENFREYADLNAARARLAHFHNTPTMAKYDARLQLAMSNTRQVDIDLAECTIETISDVLCRDAEGKPTRDKDGKYLIHTDGCGFVSPDLARRCPTAVFKGKKMTRESREEYPLLLQIRLFWRGNLWKGILCVNHTLPERTIQLRDSMLKVERDESASSDLPEPFAGLELCGTSREPAEGRLFPHLIFLLMYGGVPGELLLRLAQEAIENVRQTFKDPKVAKRALRGSGDTGQQSSMTSEALRMVHAGFLGEPRDPHLQKTLWDHVKPLLTDLSESKIPVPDTYNLIGCADPTGTLERHQVAVILKDGPICSTAVLVYKSPGLHPGDIHKMEVTYNSEFDKYIGSGKYAIFFSTKGDRAVVDEMANSDLDGDMYWICNNREIVNWYTVNPPWQPDNEEEFGSSTSALKSPKELTSQEQETHLWTMAMTARFNPSWAKGAAANNWLADMDWYFHERATGKATNQALLKNVYKHVNLYYRALDADKTGEQVIIPKGLQPAQRPHYLPGGSQKKYTSKSIVGQIYDMVKGMSPNEDFSFHPDSELDWRLDQDLVFPGYDGYFNLWREKYRQRQREANNILKNYPESERAELFERLDDSYCKALYGGVSTLREYLLQPADKKKKTLEEIMMEASAIYAMVYHNNGVADGPPEGNRVWRLGFVWKVAGTILCQIKALKTSEIDLYEVSDRVWAEIS